MSLALSGLFLPSQQRVFSIHVLGGFVEYFQHGLWVVLVQGEQKLILPQSIREGYYKYFVIDFIDRECLLIEAGYVGSQHLVFLLPDAYQACRGFLIPMSPDEVHSKLRA